MRKDVVQGKGFGQGVLEDDGITWFGEVLMGQAHGLENHRAIELAAEDDTHHRGVVLFDERQQLGPVHLRHAHVGHHHIDGLGAHHRQGLGAAADEGHLPFPAHAAQGTL